MASEQHGAHIRLAQHELTEKPEPKTASQPHASMAAWQDWLFGLQQRDNALVLAHDFEQRHGAKSYHDIDPFKHPEIAPLQREDGIGKVLPHKWYLEPHND